MGSYFCYDNPGALQDDIKHVLKLSNTEISLLYSVYSYPNMVLPILGGIFLDKIGIR